LEKNKLPPDRLKGFHVQGHAPCYPGWGLEVKSAEMKLIAEEIKHRNPWWSCYGCWKIIALALLYAVMIGVAIRDHLSG